MAGFRYLDADELKERASGSVQVVIWGTGRTAMEVAWTLDFLKIPIHAYADSDLENCGKLIGGKQVLDLEQVRQLENPFILIGSFAVQPIYEMLKAAGMENVAASLETVRIPGEEGGVELCGGEEGIGITGGGNDALQKVEEISPFLHNTLIEMYGNIGDLVLKLGILKALLGHYGRKNVTVLVETPANAEMVRLYTDNVEVVEKGHFCEDREYRRCFLKRINTGHFRRAIVLCDARLYSNRRLLNRWNCNIWEVVMNPAVPHDELLWQLDAAMLHKRLGIPMADMEPHKAGLREAVLSVAQPPELTERYVCVHMGATRRERHYDPVRFSRVAAHIVERGYQCVFIGQGEYDESFVKKVWEGCGEDDRGGIVSYVGNLSLVESFAVIAGAGFFLGTDSGMWNASYVLKKPSICLYGGGEYGCFKHDAPWIRYLTIADHSCFGCRWFCTNQTPGGYSKCMDGIQAEDIILAVDRQIDDGGR